MSEEQILTGVASAPGIAIGELFLYLRDEPDIKRYCVGESHREQAIARLQEAITKSRRQLIGLCEYLGNLIGETSARIFEAQAAILQDVAMTGEIRTIILGEGLNAESVVKDVTERWHKTMFSLEEELFRQKAQ
ncbi:MAG: phosphoenolpyruvate-utilizing N-terminal domain-containing protein, partial [Candidatus Electryoneaceae bacterium]|nr:phosphoenolpyruvate-utilizing N-terminal domain-containing protein [Candidatus Electryoneaceae bacterium]